MPEFRMKQTLSSPANMACAIVPERCLPAPAVSMPALTLIVGLRVAMSTTTKPLPTSSSSFSFGLMSIEVEKPRAAQVEQLGAVVPIQHGDAAAARLRGEQLAVRAEHQLVAVGDRRRRDDLLVLDRPERQRAGLDVGILLEDGDAIVGRHGDLRVARADRQRDVAALHGRIEREIGLGEMLQRRLAGGSAAGPSTPRRRPRPCGRPASVSPIAPRGCRKPIARRPASARRRASVRR